MLSLYGLLFRGGPAVGAVAMMGAGSDRVGLRLPLAAGAVAMLTLLAWSAGRPPRLATAFEARG